MRRQKDGPFIIHDSGIGFVFGAESDLIDPRLDARVAELADALDLGSSGQPWGFDSPLSHHPRFPSVRPDSIHRSAESSSAVIFYLDTHYFPAPRGKHS